MGIPFNIWGRKFRKTDGNCWIYLTKKEHKAIKEIMRFLGKYKTSCIKPIVEKSSVGKFQIHSGLWFLIGKHLVNVQQFGRSRVYRLSNKGKIIYKEGL